MNPYIFKRKDEPIAIINLTEDGSIVNYKLNSKNEELAPLHTEGSTNWLKEWWKRRAVPIEQGHIKTMLEKKGLLSPEDFLVKNLGLSLTDYYWISPVDSGLKWKDVNLFVNEFYDDINIAGETQRDSHIVPHYTPNSSLQGTLGKCWTIRNGKRGMIKGNRDYFSAESFNEVFATKMHELQQFDNYTPYKLIEIHGQEYQYGCFSELFTSESLELISAYDVVVSKKQPQNINSYEHFIKVCGMYGLDESVLRPFLEYQIMTDFIISGRDRHLANISVLRDANTLEFVKPAPIYDSGKSLFVNDSVPVNNKDMLKIATESFQNTELKLLGLVKDRSLVDVDKLPSAEFIRELYELDSNISENRIEEIMRGYEMKIDLFSIWQKGEDLKKIVVNFKSKPSNKNMKDIFVE